MGAISPPGHGNPSPGMDLSCPGMGSPCPGMANPCPGMDRPSPGVDSPCPGVDSPCPGVDSPCPGMDSPCHERMFPKDVPNAYPKGCAPRLSPKGEPKGCPQRITPKDVPKGSPHSGHLPIRPRTRPPTRTGSRLQQFVSPRSPSFNDSDTLGFHRNRTTQNINVSQWFSKDSDSCRCPQQPPASP